jgi:hypothetical protein
MATYQGSFLDADDHCDVLHEDSTRHVRRCMQRRSESLLLISIVA